MRSKQKKDREKKRIKRSVNHTHKTGQDATKI